MFLRSKNPSAHSVHSPPSSSIKHPHCAPDHVGNGVVESDAIHDQMTEYIIANVCMHGTVTGHMDAL